MLLERDHTIIPNQTYEPGRMYQILDIIEHKYSYAVGGWMAEYHFDEIEQNYNGSWNDYFDSHLDEFWSLLKDRTRKYFEKEFIGWCSVDGKVMNFLNPTELWEIDYNFFLNSGIDYTSSTPVRIIIHFESVEDFDYDSDLNPYYKK